MCCAAGVSVQVGLNALLAKAQPDRLLIEPTGIGHPKQIIRQLSQSPFDQVLDMRACLTLIDPRHLQDDRYTGNEYYQEQLEIADVLVANKTDQCTAEELALFDRLVEGRRPAASGKVSHGQIDLDWLKLPHTKPTRTSLLQTPVANDADSEQDLPILEPGETCRREVNQAGEFASCGWLLNDSLRFNKNALLSLFEAIEAERIKASLHTNQGDMIINAGTDGIQTTQKEHLDQNRLEVIMRGDPDWSKIEQALLTCIDSN
jgi:G3E family GTPase